MGLCDYNTGDHLLQCWRRGGRKLSYLCSGGWRAALWDWCLHRCTGSELYSARTSNSVVGTVPPFSHWGDTFLVTTRSKKRLEIAPPPPSSTLPQTKQHRTAKAHQRCRVTVYKTSHSRTDPGSADERCWKCALKQENARRQRCLWHKMAASDVTSSEIKCFWVEIWQIMINTPQKCSEIKQNNEISFQKVIVEANANLIFRSHNNCSYTYCAENKPEELSSPWWPLRAEKKTVKWKEINRHSFIKYPTESHQCEHLEFNWGNSSVYTEIRRFYW